MFLSRLPYSKSFRLCFNQLNKFTYNKPTEKLVSHSRLYHLITRNYAANPSNIKTPELVYFPQIIRWLKTKIGFKVLQKKWDPEFSEGAFIYGSSHAICRITEVISKDDKDNELENLVTPLLRKKLRDEIILNMTDTQKKIIVLSPKDIKLLIPIEVRLNQVKEKKSCTIGMRSLAVKWQDLNGVLRLVIIALQTEFVRDYTDILSDVGWTVRVFDILECGIVGDAKAPPQAKS